jgi:hypothetical protein
VAALSVRAAVTQVQTAPDAVESMLDGVHATDAVSYILAGAVLVSVTAGAALVPALRAARIDRSRFCAQNSIARIRHRRRLRS